MMVTLAQPGRLTKGAPPRVGLAAMLAVLALLHGHVGVGVGRSDEEPDICLAIAAEALEPADWPAVVAAVDAAMAARPTLIPDRSLVAIPDPGRTTHEQDAGQLRIGVWSTGGSEPSSRARHAEGLARADCGVSGAAWSATFSGSFLRAGTQRELAAAATTPGFESSIDVELSPGEQRVRTVLEFSGPLGIPNGTCWMDDRLRVHDSGRAGADVETGLRTSPFGEGVCGRFEAFLPEGGAGAQAVALLPADVALDDGTSLGFVVTTVDVITAGIELTGTLDRR